MSMSAVDEYTSLLEGMPLEFIIEQLSQELGESNRGTIVKYFEENSFEEFEVAARQMFFKTKCLLSALDEVIIGTNKQEVKPNPPTKSLKCTIKVSVQKQDNGLEIRDLNTSRQGVFTTKQYLDNELICQWSGKLVTREDKERMDQNTPFIELSSKARAGACIWCFDAATSDNIDYRMIECGKEPNVAVQVINRNSEQSLHLIAKTKLEKGSRLLRQSHKEVKLPHTETSHESLSIEFHPQNSIQRESRKGCRVKILFESNCNITESHCSAIESEMLGRIHVTAHSRKGKVEMMDAMYQAGEIHVDKERIVLFAAVFKGQQGTKAVEYCQNHLIYNISQAVQSWDLKENILAGIQKGYCLTQDEMMKDAETWLGNVSGSHGVFMNKDGATATIVLIDKTSYCVGHIGDCTLTIDNEDCQQRVTKLHTIDDIKEIRRVINEGGNVQVLLKSYHVVCHKMLSETEGPIMSKLTRSFGAFWSFSPILKAFPLYPLPDTLNGIYSEGTRFILATSGISDAMCTDDLENLCREFPKSDVSPARHVLQKAVEKCAERGHFENAAVVVVHVDPKKKQGSLIPSEKPHSPNPVMNEPCEHDSSQNEQNQIAECSQDTLSQCEEDNPRRAFALARPRVGNRFGPVPMNLRVIPRKKRPKSYYARGITYRRKYVTRRNQNSSLVQPTDSDSDGNSTSLQS